MFLMSEADIVKRINSSQDDIFDDQINYHHIISYSKPLFVNSFMIINVRHIFFQDALLVIYKLFVGKKELNWFFIMLLKSFVLFFHVII